MKINKYAKFIIWAISEFVAVFGLILLMRHIVDLPKIDIIDRVVFVFAICIIIAASGIISYGLTRFVRWMG